MTTTTKAPSKDPTAELRAGLEELDDNLTAGVDEMRAEVAALQSKHARELAELRAELEELKASAVLWADCPCGQNSMYHPRTVFNLTNAVILEGRLWHDRGHREFYGTGQ